MPLSSGTFGAETGLMVQAKLEQGMRDLVEKHISFFILIQNIFFNLNKKMIQSNHKKKKKKKN